MNAIMCLQYVQDECVLLEAGEELIGIGVRIQGLDLVGICCSRLICRPFKSSCLDLRDLGLRTSLMPPKANLWFHFYLGVIGECAG